MGLDWCLQPKPRENAKDKEEFYQLKSKLKLLSDILYGKDENDIIDENNETTNTIDTIDTIEEENSVLEKKIEELFERYNSISITPHDSISNLSDNDMIKLRNFTFGGSFESNNYDFRGKVISQSDILDETLKSEAYQHHNAEECIEYGNKLEIFLTSLNKENLDEEQKKDYEFISKAIKWLKFWGEKGHGFSAWS